MIDFEIPWNWFMWFVAATMAIGSLVRLATLRRQELQGKLDAYVQEQVNAANHKRKILVELRRRAALAQKIAAEKAKEEERSS